MDRHEVVALIDAAIARHERKALVLHSPVVLGLAVLLYVLHRVLP